MNHVSVMAIMLQIQKLDITKTGQSPLLRIIGVRSAIRDGQKHIELTQIPYMGWWMSNYLCKVRFFT